MRRSLAKSRFRRIAKWVGIALSAVIVGVWVVGAASAEGDANGPAKNPPRLEVGNYFAAISNGSLEVGWHNPAPVFVTNSRAVITGTSYVVPIPFLLLIVLIPTVLVCGLDRRKD